MTNVFNVATIEVVRLEQFIAGERWVQIRCHYAGDGSPLLVQLPEVEWVRAVGDEASHLSLQVDELTAQRDAFGQKAHQLQERVKELEDVVKLARHALERI